MTNLEFYKDELKRYIKNDSKEAYLKSDTIGKAFTLFAKERIDIWCNDIWAEPEHFIDWLLQEHKEPIKLKQWEKDFLETLQCEEVKFCCHELLLEMRYKGHFKGITDTTMKLSEILASCEVIDDD